MNPSTDFELEVQMRLRGASSARELAAALKVSQPTFSRRLRAMGERVLRIGQGRATSYGLRHVIEPIGESWPLYRLDEKGEVHRAGVLHALEARQWVFEAEEPWLSLLGGEPPSFPLGLFPDLPWFLNDQRPQGFLGRLFVRRYYPVLRADPDLTRWGVEDVVRGMVLYGEDLPGAWILGKSALERMHALKRDPVAEEACGVEYVRMAESVLEGEVGSSAGGEQPKFTACVRSASDEVRCVIVKFCSASDRPEDGRWRDLLLAEDWAGRVLRGDGLPAAESRIVQGGGRTFLESVRFDRVGANGRKGMVSLAALDGAFFGMAAQPWTEAADRLERSGWVTPEDAELLKTHWWFGQLIGNTDMHYGNVSFYLTPQRPFRLAPLYDMLPMFYRPNREGRIASPAIAPGYPPPEELRCWNRAARLAAEFWQRVQGDERISPAFRALAAENETVVNRLRERFLGSR